MTEMRRAAQFGLYPRNMISPTAEAHPIHRELSSLASPPELHIHRRLRELARLDGGGIGTFDPMVECIQI